MALYYYLKAPPAPLHSETKPRWLSAFLIGFGGFILAIVFGSMGIYQWRANNYVAPAPPVSTQIKEQVLGEANTGTVNYSNPSQWFTTLPQLGSHESRITHYNLSIPALKINQAVVEIGGEDLGKSMVHYPGTAMPGETGNAVVFCHSVLPQFFNPKNYKTICSTLPTIALGSEILLSFDGIEYTYQVINLREVSPNDISVLNQDDQGEFLSLITCVPPGTYLRRLVVRARLV